MIRYILISLTIATVVFIFIYFFLDQEKTKVAQNLDLFKQVLLDIKDNKAEVNTPVVEAVAINLIDPRNNEKAGVVLEMIVEENIVYRLVELRVAEELQVASTYDIWLRDSSNPVIKTRLGQINSLVNETLSKLEFNIPRREHVYDEIVLSLQTSDDLIDEELVVLKGVLRPTSSTTVYNL